MPPATSRSSTPRATSSRHDRLRQKGAVFRQLNQSADYVSSGDFSMSTGIRLDRALPAAWGLDLPVNISHTQSSATPRFLERSDVVAADLAGLRDTGGGSTSFGMRVASERPARTRGSAPSSMAPP